MTAPATSPKYVLEVFDISLQSVGPNSLKHPHELKPVPLEVAEAMMLSKAILSV
jgi:hypothetical protein